MDDSHAEQPIQPEPTQQPGSKRFAGLRALGSKILAPKVALAPVVAVLAVSGGVGLYSALNAPAKQASSLPSSPFPPSPLFSTDTPPNWTRLDLGLDAPIPTNAKELGWACTAIQFDHTVCWVPMTEPTAKPPASSAEAAPKPSTLVDAGGANSADKDPLWLRSIVPIATLLTAIVGVGAFILQALGKKPPDGTKSAATP